MQGQDFEGILSVGMLSDSTISVGESTEGAPFLGIALLGLGFCAAFAIWMRFWGDRLFMLKPEFASTPLRKLLSFVAWYLGLKPRQFEGNPASWKICALLRASLRPFGIRLKRTTRSN